MWRINSSEELFSTKKTTINVDLDFKFKETVYSFTIEEYFNVLPSNFK